MNEVLAEISRSWMGMADEAINSSGIPPFPYKKKESVLGIIYRVMGTERFTEIGSNYYIKSWVFLFNDQAVGCVTHRKNEITIKAFIDNLPELKSKETAKFYFEGILNKELEEYLSAHGIKQITPNKLL